MYHKIVSMIGICIGLNICAMEGIWSDHERRAVEAHAAWLALQLYEKEQSLTTFKILAEKAPEAIVDLALGTHNPAYVEIAYALLPKQTQKSDVFSAICSRNACDTFLPALTRIDGMNRSEELSLVQSQLNNLHAMPRDMKLTEEWRLVSVSPALQQEYKELEAIPLVDNQTPFHRGYGQESGIGYDRRVVDL